MYHIIRWYKNYGSNPQNLNHMRNYRSIWGSIAAIAMFTLVSCKSAVDHNKVITVNFGEVNKKRAVNLCIHGKRILESKEKVYWDDLGLRNLKAEGGMDSYIEKAEKKPSIKDFCIF